MIRRTRILAYSGTFIALIAAGSWISIPLPPVPLTLQTLFVLLAGIVMKRYGVIPVGLYVLLGAANLPMFHNGTAGQSIQWRVGGLILATTVIYLFGVAWLAYSASLALPQAVLLGVAPFVIGEVVKVAAAYSIGKRLA